MAAKSITGNPVVDMIAARMEKKFKLPLITKGPTIKEAETVSTGSLSLDAKMRIQGLPIDRCIEIFGPPSGGKTSLALQIMKQWVDKYGYSRPPVFIDLERTTSEDLVRNMGIDPDQVVWVEPETAEQALQVAQELGESGAVGLIIFDSVDAAEAESMAKRDIGQMGVGDLPRLLSQAMRRLSKICMKNKVMYIFINQIRMKIGTMYGNPETTSGGNAIPFYCSVRLRVQSKLSSEEEGALTMKVKIVKNKLATPAATPAEFTFIAGRGIDTFQDTLSFARDQGLIRYAGKAVYATYYDQEETKVCLGGKEGAKEFYSDPDNQEDYERLRTSCFIAAGVLAPATGEGRTTESDSDEAAATS